MEILVNALVEAARLLITGDADIWQVTLLSLQVSLTATLLSLLVGLPLGTALALTSFPGRNIILGLVNTGLGMPPVVAGLIITILLWRSGPLGGLRLLYTPTAITIAVGV